MTRRSRWFIVILAAAAVFLAVAAELRLFLDTPIATLATPRTVLIPPRATLRDVAMLLEGHEVIPRGWIFVLWTKLLGLEGKLRYGEYTFGGPQTIKGILDTLVSGRVTLHELVIPEGFTLRQIAERADENGLGQATEILAAGSDGGVLQRLGIPGSSVEGFLYPDTYLLPRDLPAERLLEKLVGRFREVYTPELRQREAALGMTTLEVVTLASIIEKEAMMREELPLISAVFHNRLRKGIPLMADPAVIYGIEDFDGNLRKADLQRPGPYNVYLNKGLPPGPICNPGLASLRAALHPAEVDFLFFVSKNNGTHYFSRKLAEHNEAVNLYQRSRTN